MRSSVLRHVSISVFFFLDKQESGCSLLQGPISHAGLLGARAVESECWLLAARDRQMVGGEGVLTRGQAGLEGRWL